MRARFSRLIAHLISLFVLAGALLHASAEAQTPAATGSLAAARSGFKTRITFQSSQRQNAPAAPGTLFWRVQYPSPAGKLAAYYTPDPRDGKKHPAIIWLTGGDSNSLDDFWIEGPRDNDQSASAYRKAGIVTMFPTLRGGNTNPGAKEAMYGEVDDILAAADFLATLPYVDPRRIYLGGHSTGGTLVLLTAEVSDRFRAVFAFGPVGRIESYGGSIFPVNFRTVPPLEAALRSPAPWLAGIRGKVFVIEGENAPGNLDELQAMRRASTNPNISFLAVKGASHFSVLAPANEVIARKILGDTGPNAMSLTEAELAR
jgi:dienelactone hydrolase